MEMDGWNGIGYRIRYDGIALHRIHGIFLRE